MPTCRPRTRLPKSTRPSTRATTAYRSIPSTSLLGHTSKRDKRIIKHSALLSRISRSHLSSHTQRKRRRPSKKLVANLESLADALPDALEGREEKQRAEGEDARIRHRSLGSRPGRAKRREKEVKGEKERFERNMARMLGGVGQKEGNLQSGERWKALRGFIELTMERREDGES